MNRLLLLAAAAAVLSAQERPTVLKMSGLFDGRGKTVRNMQDVTAAGRAVFVMNGGKVYENLTRGSKSSTNHAPIGAR